jgi:hypothetical protein
MLRFREHRAVLADSLATEVELGGREELIAYIRRLLPERVIRDEDVEVKAYAYDPRTGWQTYIVTIKDYGVIGFTDTLV